MNALTHLNTSAVVNGNGRQPNGQFGPGNRLGRGGSLHARKVASYRAAIFACAKVSDFKEIAQALIREAKKGQPWAVALAFKYLVGEPAQVLDVTHRTEADGLVDVPEVVESVLASIRKEDASRVPDA